MKIFKKEFDADIIEDKTLCIEGFALIYSKKLTNGKMIIYIYIYLDQFIEKLTKYHKRLSKFEDPKKNKIELILKVYSITIFHVFIAISINEQYILFFDHTINNKRFP